MSPSNTTTTTTTTPHSTHPTSSTSSTSLTSSTSITPTDEPQLETSSIYELLFFFCLALLILSIIVHLIHIFKRKREERKNSLIRWRYNRHNSDLELMPLQPQIESGYLNEAFDATEL